jgi:anti-anti-sigma factor
MRKDPKDTFAGGNMEIIVSKAQGKVPVTVVQPHGHLDSSTYTDLIDNVRKLITEGGRDFVIDLQDVSFMSSAGMMAIHSLALMLRGEKPADLKERRAALKSMDTSRASGVQQHIKLLSPQAGVVEAFEKAGFTQFFEIFDDLESAVASF